MDESLDSLTYAVRPQVLYRYLGQLALVLALLTAVPLAASLLFADYRFTWRYLLVIALLVVAALPALRRPDPRLVQTNEALVVVAGVFLLAPLVMLYPMCAAGAPPLDTLFECISAVTTTGLSTLSGIEGKPATFLFARAWMQWYGGLGIVVLSVALVMGHHLAARQLAEPMESEHFPTTARTYARQMLAVYAALTALGVLLLWPTEGTLFPALLHTLSAVSTGGFSIYDDSAAGLTGWPSRLLLVAIAALGALPFGLYLKAGQRRWREVVGDPELRTYLALCALVSALLTFTLMQSGFGWRSGLENGIFLGLSAQSTTGFTTLNIASLPASTKLALIPAMAVGGGLGSTAGGLKLLRFAILLRLAQLVLRRAATPPHALVPPRLAGRTIDADDLQRLAAMLLLYAAVTLLSWLAFVGFGHDPLNSLFEVVSAVGTVGLSAGLSSPALEPLLKVVLCFDMLLGRLEVIALLTLVYPRTWFGKRIDYP